MGVVLMAYYLSQARVVSPENRDEEMVVVLGEVLGRVLFDDVLVAHIAETLLPLHHCRVLLCSAHSLCGTLWQFRLVVLQCRGGEGPCKCWAG